MLPTRYSCSTAPTSLRMAAAQRLADAVVRFRAVAWLDQGDRWQLDGLGRRLGAQRPCADLGMFQSTGGRPHRPQPARRAHSRTRPVPACERSECTLADRPAGVHSVRTSFRLYVQICVVRQLLKASQYPQAGVNSKAKAATPAKGYRAGRLRIVSGCGILRAKQKPVSVARAKPYAAAGSGGPPPFQPTRTTWQPDSLPHLSRRAGRVCLRGR